MIGFALNIYNFIKPHLAYVPIRYTPEGSLVTMFVLIYLSKFVHAFLSFALLQKYDNVQAGHRYGPKVENHDPSKQQQTNSWKVKAVARAYSAHSNHWEAFTGFAAAVLLALLTAPSQREELTLLTNTFIYVRIVYNIVYVLAYNEPLSFVRSSVWAIGFAIIVKIFTIAVPNITI